MFEIPYTTSLGPPAQFDRLASLVRGNKRLWRKVARMVSKRHKYKTNTYLAQALTNTQIPFEVKLEIMDAFGMGHRADYVEHEVKKFLGLI